MDSQNILSSERSGEQRHESWDVIYMITSLGSVVMSDSKMFGAP